MNPKTEAPGGAERPDLRVAHIPVSPRPALTATEREELCQLLHATPARNAFGEVVGLRRVSANEVLRHADRVRAVCPDLVEQAEAALGHGARA